MPHMNHTIPIMGEYPIVFTLEDNIASFEVYGMRFEREVTDE